MESLLHYRMIKKLGQGGMGVVYLAEDTRLKRQIALKILTGELASDPTALRRFQIEAQASARLNHPHIAAVYSVEQTEGRCFITMEHLDGRTLKECMQTGGLPLATFLEWFAALAEAMAHAHEKGILHRDIKPANIMITAEGGPKIMDFGLARIQSPLRTSPEGAVTDSGLTRLGTIMGSPAYMSPEQSTGQPVDQRSDIFSFAVVLYEALSGRKPFAANNFQEMTRAILNDVPAPVGEVRPGLPLLLAHVVAKGLEKDPRRRYQTARDMANDLRTVQKQIESGSVSVASAAEAAAVPPGVKGRPRRLAWAMALILLLLGASLGGYLSAPRRPAVNAPRRVLDLPMEISAELVGMPSGAAIAPDGMRIATIENGTLFVRDLNRRGRRSVAGTQGAVGQPFWSPDSGRIGFFSEWGRVLNTIAADGATPAVRVCDTAGSGLAKSAAWNAAGEIVFDAWSGDFIGGRSLFRVLATGGTPERLPFGGDAGNQYVQMPHFLPHGKGLLYTVQHADGSCELALSKAGRSTTILRLSDDRIAFPFYVPQGLIVFQRGWINRTAVWAVPYSLSKLAVVGEPFEIAPNSGWPSASEDGTLVYLSEPPRTQQLVWLDRSGQIMAPIGPPLPETIVGGISLSPDSRKVAIDTYLKGLFEDIWIVDADRNALLRLTYEETRDAEPAWAPEGDRVAFTSERSGTTQIFVKAIDPHAQALPLISTDLDKFSPCWSPAGDYLVFHMRSPETRRDIWFVDLKAPAEGSLKPFLQSRFEDAMPQLSPDGRYIAYMSDLSGVWEIYLRSFPGGTGEWQVSVNGGMYPRWSARSGELFYVSGTDLTAVKVVTHPRLSIGTPARLFSWPHLGMAMINRYDVSSDGRRIAAVKTTAAGAATLVIDQNWSAGR